MFDWSHAVRPPGKIGRQTAHQEAAVSYDVLLVAPPSELKPNTHQREFIKPQKKRKYLEKIKM